MTRDLTPDATSPRSPEVTVVVPTYQRRRTVARTLELLLAQEDAPPYEVVVVDNGTTDGTTEDLLAIAAEAPYVRVLRIDDNRGPGPARNAGWRAARAPVVAFTDDDTEPATDWLAELVAPFDAGADLVMGRTIPDPEAFGQAGPFSHWVRVEKPMPWFPTCNIAYRRDLLDRTGGFDEEFTARFGSSFGDDTDLGWKALTAGADARFAPRALVVHEVTRSDFRAHLRAARRRGGVPGVVARYPGLRAQLPLPYVYTQAHRRAGLAAVGLAILAARPRATTSWVAAGVLARPYLAFRIVGPGVRPGRRSRTPWVVAGHLVSDLAEMTVVARHAARNRTLLL